MLSTYQPTIYIIMIYHIIRFEGDRIDIRMYINHEYVGTSVVWLGVFLLVVPSTSSSVSCDHFLNPLLFYYWYNLAAPSIPLSMRSWRSLFSLRFQRSCHVLGANALRQIMDTAQNDTLFAPVLHSLSCSTSRTW